ncbi:endonuclease/exonuclease/phosphatase family protein [Drepanopeziza brunnea f. sp. 'multigermtubi' MB_m1]|uniref:Endonuclease/exonuclease/phosphatase family protein n=1 Tax=Marssonina brunnea f. sp. multigermtubi (strain MB_m1) TaxID=1072389 RepID=K1XUJ6_MARBU|nr:endonuclease/exonuclease/phosphatase family protein [Drepanopeziza brunnea f. sp. 'multigermtubi' MB_m1]EKD16409.1 endonuclease/exonuclease/phosphatase family protein [Drepanopeziza brunnea f. sp. 'multigermtubi' MB_m1]
MGGFGAGFLDIKTATLLRVFWSTALASWFLLKSSEGKMRFSLVISTAALALNPPVANAVTINEINGIRYISPYNNQAVSGVQGLVTAKSSAGFYLRQTTAEEDDRSSNSIYVFGAAGERNVTVGDIVTLDATVSEYRSQSNYLFLTELTAPSNIVIVSSGNEVTPRVIGEDPSLQPPTEAFSSLDDGDVYSVPNNQSLISVVNPILEPLHYGMDFWESLTGELVTVKAPTAITKSNRFGDVWVVGPWETSGKNQRGGLTMRDLDSNPEAIYIVSPLDGTANPLTVKLGDTLEEITGVVTAVFGYYAIIPRTAIKTVASALPAVAPATTLVSEGSCSGLTVGVYNVANLAPGSSWLPSIADHIATLLKTPDLMFLEEIQDDTGPTVAGNVVSANLTLATLANAIYNISGVQYAWTDIDPIYGMDGGEPGGNIRQAYLYNPATIRLRKPNPGGALDANEVLPGPELKFNPGRIDPTNAAFRASRKPLVAAWETLDGQNLFFTVNVHQGSKGGGSPLMGDARPPVNGALAPRTAQSNITATFIAQILAADPSAKIIAAGDFNEFSFVQPLEIFTSVSQLLDLDDAVSTPAEERYSYMFDMNCQALDHMFVSPALLAPGAAAYEHVHVNTWASFPDQVSDHDPGVAKLDLCS